MRKGSCSEAFLSLFTTADMAASIVGDLLEERLGRCRYWLRVAGIGMALCLRSVRSVPGRCLGLVLLGSLVYLGVWSVVLVASGLPWFPWNRVGQPEFWLRAALLESLANALTGFVLGRWVSFGGTNALAPLLLLRLAAWPAELAVIALLHIHGPFATPLGLLVFAALGYPLLGLLPLTVGGAVGRRTARA